MEHHDAPGPSSTSDSGKSSAKARLSHMEHIRTHSSTSRFSRGHKQQSSVTIASDDQPRFDIDHYRAWARRQRNKAKANTWARFEKLFNAWYQKWIIEILLRQYPLPPSKDGRHVPLTFGDVRKTPLTDERTVKNKPYISNFIRSTRYTIWSFFPKQLYFQFSKLANFYFLIIAILQVIPGLSTVGSYTTIATLIPFIAISMAKEGWDDYRRYQLDKKENRSNVSVLDPDKTISAPSRKPRRGQEEPRPEMATAELDDFNQRTDVWSKIQWQKLRVGDIVRLHRDESVPADIVLLHATGPSGIAYIETMALDGETNLKSKQACPLLAKRCKDLSKLKHCDAQVVSEDPNIDLYNYEGRVTVDGETMPLTLNEVVYRGSILRNTVSAIGLVINTGEECKIRMNANQEIHAKMPAMQRKINHIVLFLVAFVGSLAIGLTTANEIWKRRYLPRGWYLRTMVPVKEILIGYIIMFNTVVPLSLIVSLEIIKLGQLFLLQDVEMYDAETNTPMVANTTTILEDLGQVSYVFSDKTGTLTENKMRFRKLSVAGNAFLHDADVRRDEEEKQRRIESFKGKGKMKVVDSADVSEAKPVEPTKTPLISHPANTPRRSSSHVWTSTGRPLHAQPEVNTESLLHYIYQKPNTAFSQKARQFLLCIALCHTCLPETKDDGKIEFQAASPDELALVQAAQDLGYLLVDRPSQSVVLQIRNSEEGPVSTEKYEVLDVIEFSSKRKRMSIIIRMPDGSICVFCKGADSVILPRLKLAHLAMQKASDISRKATLRKSVEATRALQRKSMQAQHSIDIVRAASAKQQSFRGVNPPKKSSVLSDEVANWLDHREHDDLDDGALGDAYQSPIVMSPVNVRADDELGGLVDESIASSDSAIFERCFQHIDDFASEGLRTLLYAHRYISEEDYTSWRKTYQAATTSLVDRQKRIEEAGELIEQGFDLSGATAIEDKLQTGVPETIDKLRRANIKVWMLTGDKRETAINIAHSARICKPFSDVYILDATKGDLPETMASTLVEVGRGMVAHSVVVIDGHTLSVVDDDETLKAMFFDLAVRADSVICCRASPSQKADLVKCIRETVPSSITLAIGDGANDIAMIQASHVGIGISGREGLQAARTSDYSIAQFRFLQRLLFVHGRWNYLRTGKYVLATFWKEIVFYMCQAQYQRWNGYTGTSLFESVSLAIFNALFTSLCVILPGVFEKDLEASTLLAVPELYTYGQRNEAFKYKKYIGWNIMALFESIILYTVVQQLYGWHATDLFSMGQLIFMIAVIFINTKLFILEMHNKTIVPLIGWLLMIGAWFLWNIFLSTSRLAHKNEQVQFPTNNNFTGRFGREALWWITCILALAALIIFELCVTALRRVYFPTDQDLWQEIEHLGVGQVLKEHATTNDAERGDVQHENSGVAGASGIGIELGKIDSGGTVESR